MHRRSRAVAHLHVTPCAIQTLCMATHVPPACLGACPSPRFLSCLSLAAAQIHSRRIFTHVHLKGAGSYNGDFIVSKLSPLVNRWGGRCSVLHCVAL
jgi:hypothetical protein